MQAVEFRPLEVTSHTARPNAGTEEALIGINISYSVQQLLIQQSSLDRGFAGTKQCRELVLRNFERLLPRSSEARGLERHPAKAPGIHKA